MDNNSFAEKLQRLFEEVKKPDGTQYSSSEVVEGTHGVLTRAHLWKLRKGKTSNPSFHVIKAISEFFGVDPSYFFESGTDVAPIADDQRQELVRQVALRSSGMGTDELQTVLLMFDSIAKLKNRE